VLPANVLPAGALPVDVLPVATNLRTSKLRPKAEKPVWVNVKASTFGEFSCFFRRKNDIFLKMHFDDFEFE
jgi:hypothetical protein